MADLLRSIALLESGVVVGLAAAEAWLYWRRKRTPGDPWFGHRRLDYMVGVRIALLLLTAMVCGVMVDRIGEADISWRAPSAILAFSVAIWGMHGILRDDETIQDDPSVDYRRHGRRSTDRELG